MLHVRKTRFINIYALVIHALCLLHRRQINLTEPFLCKIQAELKCKYRNIALFAHLPNLVILRRRNTRGVNENTDG